MKKQAGIWVDGSKAIIVALFNGNETIEEIYADIENKAHHKLESVKGTFKGSHHINKENKLEERKKHHIDHFLDKVLDCIKAEDELYVFGPGELKIYLKKRIEKDDLLAPKLQNVEAADSMTINQVVAKVKEFYEKIGQSN